MSKGKITDVLPAEITDTPIIGMQGNREITVDGFKGIEEYTDTEVCFRTAAMMITVYGSNLLIRYLSIHTIVISGNIKNVSFSDNSETEASK